MPRSPAKRVSRGGQRSCRAAIFLRRVRRVWRPTITSVPELMSRCRAVDEFVNYTRIVMDCLIWSWTSQLPHVQGLHFH